MQAFDMPGRGVRRGMMVAVLALAAHGAGAEAVDAADAVAIRKANFKEIGGAFKSLRDEIRSGRPDVNAIGSSARDLARRAEVVSTLFPPGSGPGAGVETRARPGIWQTPAEFDAVMRRFAASSADLFMAVRANDRGAMQTAFKAVGETCKSCHDRYRVPD